MSDDDLDDVLEEIDAEALVEEIEDVPDEDVEVCHPYAAAKSDRESWRDRLTSGWGGDRSV